MRQRNVKNLQTTIKQKLNQHTNKIWINTKKPTMQPGNQSTNRPTKQQITSKRKRTHTKRKIHEKNVNKHAKKNTSKKNTKQNKNKTK